MRTFGGAVLVRGIRAGQLRLLSKVGERIQDLTTAVEFPTTIHANVFVGT